MSGKRLTDIANFSYNRGIPAFSDFLDLSQQAEYMELISDKKNMPPVKSFLYGGIFFDSDEDDFTERKIACFIPENIKYEIEYPVSVLKISPVNEKFSDELTHRDFLGSLMNIGIERHLIGDILVKNNTAHIFVITRMAPYIAENIVRIKNTTVTCKICNGCDIDFKPSFQEEKGSVASERLDAVIAFACRMSRNDSVSLISAGRVFINGREIISKSYVLKPGDKISVRGKGKFIFDDILSETKKGRYFIKIRKYI